MLARHLAALRAEWADQASLRGQSPALKIGGGLEIISQHFVPKFSFLVTNTSADILT